MEAITLLLAGDVMTGRGIDQVLPHSVDPRLHEPWVKDARRYVDLAEAEHGEIPAPVDYDYLWGDALPELERAAPTARIVNLETAVTTHGEPWPGKGIHYRMHPENVPVLTAAGIDCCVLANNHVLDWGRPGLEETLDALRRAGLRTAGAGRNLAEARQPAVLATGGEGRVLVIALGSVTSGVPKDWAAGGERSGVFLLPAPPADPVDAVPEVTEALDRVRRPGDLVVASIHQGGNWGYEVPPAERHLAHALIDRAGVDVVHGHSSHHVKGIEVHAGRLVLYGCGDLVTDYEGIGGHEEYRGGLGLLYLPEIDPATGELQALTMIPLTQRRFRLERTSDADARWLADLLTREGEPFGTRADLDEDRRLRLRWDQE